MSYATGLRMVGGPALLSPRARVIWDAFESNTSLMQRCGWEFAVDTSPHSFSSMLDVIARHRQTGLVMRMSGSRLEFDCAVCGDGRLGAMVPTLKVTGFNHEQRVEIWQIDIQSFMQADMTPYAVHRADHKTFAVAGLFTPWSQESKEIIVEPKTVQSLLEEIKRMQEPELAEIRRRNRQRAKQEEVVAQVIAFAA